MRLVDDDDVVGIQEPVVPDLGEQQAIRDQLHQGPRTDPVAEPHGVADRVTDRDVQLERYPRRDAPRGQAPRLGMADHAAPSEPGLETDLRQLRGLPRAGFARDDDHLVLPQQPADLGGMLADRQVRRILEARHDRPTRLELRARGLQPRSESGRVAAVQAPECLHIAAHHLGRIERQPAVLHGRTSPTVGAISRSQS